jgi:hypothetical protein
MKRWQTGKRLRKSNLFVLTSLSLVLSHTRACFSKPVHNYRVTPVLNIVQTFLNERDLYTAVVNLPNTMDFVSVVTKLATHPKFKVIECKYE